MKHEHRPVTSRRGLLPWLCVAALALGHVSVNANVWVTDTGWQLKPGPDGVWQVLPEGGRGGQHTTTCTTLDCRRTGSVTGPLGNPKPTLSPYANFDKAAIARGALNLGTRALPWLSLGYGLYDWYTSAGIQQSADGLTGADPYNPAVFGSGIYQFNTQPDKRLGYGTRDAACQAYNAYRVSIGMVALADIYARLANGIWYCSGRLPNGSNSSTAAVITAAPSTSCPFGTANAQGQCPYTAQQQPISVDSAFNRLIDAPITSQQLRMALQEILAAGGSLQSTGTGVTGPATAPGPQRTTTATTANGTQAVTTYNTTYNYTYNNNTVKVTTTEKKTNPDGSTEEINSDTPDLSECQKNPAAAQCAELGNVSETPLTPELINSQFAAVDFASSAQCPAPATFALNGRSHEFSFQPMCDAASTWIRGVVMLLAATVAAWVFIQGLKS